MNEFQVSENMDVCPMPETNPMSRYSGRLLEMFERLDAAGAIEQLRSTLQHYQPKSFDLLQDLVVECCADARRYADRTTPDKFERRRQRDREARREIPAQIKAARRLQAFLSQYPELGDSSSKVLLTNEPRAQNPELIAALKTSPKDVWQAFLVAYETVLRSAQRFAKKLLFLHGWQVGPLLYPKQFAARAGAHPKVAETGLLFQLTLYFRRFSRGLPHFDYLQNGEPMPTYGHPHYEVSSLLIAAALDLKPPPNPKTLRKRLDDLLTDNKGIGLAAWPNGD